MVNYEMMLLIKKLPRPQLVDCVNKLGINLLNNKCILRKIEYLGFNKLYEKLKDPANPTDKKSKLHEANYFLIHFDSPPMFTNELSDNYLKLSRDILRFKIYRKINLISEHYECDLNEDLKPPVYRKTVRKMMETGDKFRTKQEFNNPFKPMN